MVHMRLSSILALQKTHVSSMRQTTLQVSASTSNSSMMMSFSMVHSPKLIPSHTLARFLGTAWRREGGKRSYLDGKLAKKMSRGVQPMSPFLEIWFRGSRQDIGKCWNMRTVFQW